ncbi:MAG: hypothetical protein J0H14_12510 [Alphaproteobacteria bacterium]|nr:hypothetical protein [Rhodospirillales bacterium]MBN9561532.1 hypothetical protein [Alphaproteobacteria bacterium]
MIHWSDPRSVAAILAVILPLAAAGCQQVAVSPRPAADALPPPGNLEPPPNLGAPPPTTHAQAPGWDGAYAGEGLLTFDPGGQITCPNRMPVYGMNVADGRVHFGDYRGTIRPDGTVQMPFGQSSISGRFADGRFIGNLYQPFPGCRYELRLSRSGS